MKKKIFMTALCLAIFAASVSAGVLDDAREAQLDGKYGVAADILRKAAAADPKRADEYLYLLASNLYTQNRPTEAVAAAEKIISGYPTSPWYYKALFKKADALILLGKMDEAEKIYEQQTERILSVDRKEHIAKIYIEYADRFFEPVEKEQAPDYSKALQFYRKALEAGLPKDKTLYARLRSALCLYRSSNAYEAITEFSNLLAIENITDEYRAPALYNLGLSYIAAGDARNARKSFKNFLDEFPNDESAPEAAFRIGMSYNLPNPYSDKDLELGVQAMKSFIEKFSGNEKAPEAFFTIAITYYNRGRYEDAIEQLKNLLGMFGGKENVDEVPRAQMFIGECYFSQEKYPEAITAWEKFAAEYPVHPDWNKSKKRILDAEFAIAKKLLDEKNYDAARKSFEGFLERHPIDERARDAMFNLGDIEYRLKNYREAVELWRPLVSKHPDSEPASHAQFLIAEIYDTQFDDQEQALKEYGNVTGSYRGDAIRRISEMKTPEITVMTEKSFNTGEKASLKLSLRNVETVTVKAYRINMEEYFNKYHTINGVENLDIALIDPDLSWEYHVDGYRKYKKYETDLEPPIKGAGVYAVTVATDDMEVTSLLLVTDIALITKTSRDQVFIYAQNMKTNEPAAGVKILLFDGSETFEAGKTGRDGVLQYSKKEGDRDFSSISAMGILGENVTSNSLRSGSYSSSNPGASKGLIYTDRPAYRPGQEMNARGIFRLVKNGGFDFRSGAPYKAEVRAPDGTLVCEESGTLSEFGTFNLPCPISVHARPGNWNIKTTVDNEHVITASFTVQEYKLDRMRLDISLEKDIFMRGDIMKGTLKAAYYFGAPVSGKTLTWTISGGGENATGSGTTDENGEVTFEFDTTDLDETALLNISAAILDENIYKSETAWVTVTEFEMSVSTLREFYLSGEPFDVTVKTADVKGRPTSAMVHLEVLQKVSGGSGSAELKIKDIVMKESAKGVSRAHVSLDKTGYYTLRAFSKDFFGNIISSDTSIYISGDDDDTKLRIIADRDEFLVGESPSVRLVFRDSSAMALVTMEGEDIYSYRLVKLAKGENNLKLDITPELAPNFILSVSVMSGGKFHSASKNFDALQGLKISIEPEKEVYAPGEKMKLKIKTTDQYGTPVRAELSLAMVDEALYAQFADNTPRLGEFFYGTKRPGFFDTSSTYVFSYNGVLKRIAKDVVAEMEKSDDEYTTESKDRAPGKKMEYLSKAKMAPRAESPGEMKLMGGEGSGYAYDAAEMDEEAYLAAPSPSSIGGALAPVARLREYFPETGFWAPSVITGTDGSAEITIPLPDNATTWRITSRGITKDTMVGEQTASIVTKEKLFITVKAPSTVVEGSIVGVTAEIHNTTDKELNVTVNFSIAENGEKESRKITVAAGSSVEEFFSAESKTAGTLSVFIEALSSEFSDSVKQDIKILPQGKLVAEVKSGISSENAAAEIALPGNLSLSDRELTIRISPSLQQSVLDVVFPEPYSNDDAALKAISILYRLKYLGTADKGAEYVSLSGELPVLLSRIASSMDRNGMKRWSGATSSNTTGTCHGVWALSMASSMGFNISATALNTGLQNLEDRFTKSSSNDEKAEILHALSLENRADAAYLNRLDREKGSLGVRALGFLTLAFSNMGRDEYAQSAAKQLEASLDSIITPMPETKRIIKDTPDIRIFPPPFNNSERALALLAVETAAPSSPAVKKLKEEIESSRWGRCWSGAEMTSYSIAALSTFYSATAFTNDRYTLDVKVNGSRIETVTADNEHPLVEIKVPASNLSDSNKIEFSMNGRGTYSWSAVMTAFTTDMSYREDMMLNGTKIVLDGYTMSPTVINGKEFSPGSSVTEDYPTVPGNITHQVRIGNYVTAGFHTYTDYNMPQPGFTIVEYPIPGGVSLEKETVSGNFEFMETRDGYVVFYCSNNCSATMRLYGNVEGVYKINPAVFYSQSTPEIKYYYSYDSGTFEVIPSDKNPDTTYELSADQLYYYGKDLFDAGEYEQSWPLIENLIGNYKVRGDYFKEAHKMMMYTCIERDNSRCIVEHFEVLKEKYPTLSLEFEDVLRVGKAYADMEEHERAVQVYLTALEASFMQDGEARIFLEDMGELHASVSFLKNLTREYPDMNILKNSVYSTGHVLFSNAMKANNSKASRDKKLDKDSLLTAAATAYNTFMLYYPESSYADEAAFSLMSSVFEFGDNEEVISLATKFRKRFPSSPLLDSYEYLEAYANFEAGNFDRALKLCAGISENQYFDKKGKLAPSDNINEARYLSGQIYHAMNKPDQAAEFYEKVSGQFADAGLALEYFNRKVFTVPQVITSPAASGASVPLTHRNTDSVHLKVYKIDLMKFYLLRKSLSGMSGIQLSGVKPVYEKTMTLSTGREYRDRTTNISIPLKEDGAYLVELRTGGRYTSTILLRTNLEMEVQEDAATGLVRVNVLDTRSKRYVSNASVKVVGSNDGKIQSGSTDLRGIFTAENVYGTAAVLCRKSDQYAFYSGEQQLSGNRGSKGMKIDADMMRNVNTQNILNDNMMIQQQSADYLRQNFTQQESGVQIQQIQQQMMLPNQAPEIQYQQNIMR